MKRGSKWQNKESEGGRGKSKPIVYVVFLKDCKEKSIVRLSIIDVRLDAGLVPPASVPFLSLT